MRSPFGGAGSYRGRPLSNYVQQLTATYNPLQSGNGARGTTESATAFSPFTLVGIDPGATAGIVVMRFRPRDTHHRLDDRPPEVSILAGQVILSEHVLEDPTAAGVSIARAAVLLAQAHEASAVAIEIPKGAIRRQVTTSYGAQRETIGAVRALLRAYEFRDLQIAPNSAKMALTGSGKADKRAMMDRMKSVHGWERLWDSAQARLEAKADAVGICMAGAAIWRRRLQEAA